MIFAGVGRVTGFSTLGLLFSVDASSFIDVDVVGFDGEGSTLDADSEGSVILAISASNTDRSGWGSSSLLWLGFAVVPGEGAPEGLLLKAWRSPYDAHEFPG
jgi:hypothetical protein